MKRIGTLTALAVGCAFGFGTATVMLGSGCVLGGFAIHKAMADDVVTVDCSLLAPPANPGASVFATFDLPDDTPETFARLTVVETTQLCDANHAKQSHAIAVTSTGTKISVPCLETDCNGKVSDPHGVFTFVMR